MKNFNNFINEDNNEKDTHYDSNYLYEGYTKDEMSDIIEYIMKIVKVEDCNIEGDYSSYGFNAVEKKHHAVITKIYYYDYEATEIDIELDGKFKKSFLYSFSNGVTRMVYKYLTDKYDYADHLIDGKNMGLL